MAYWGDVSNQIDGLGCGKTCACKSCSGSGTVSEWYVEDADADGDDKNKKSGGSSGRVSGVLTPEQIELERRIARAGELWRPAIQAGPRRYINAQLGAVSGPLRLGIHPMDLASAQHLGWVGLSTPAGTMGAQLAAAIATCLRDLGKPGLIGRAGAMAACMAGFLAGPAAAPLVWTCLKMMGVVLTLSFVAQLLVCVAAKMAQRPVPARA